MLKNSKMLSDAIDLLKEASRHVPAVNRLELIAQAVDLLEQLSAGLSSERKELIPHQLVHPGGILASELKARGMTENDLKGIFPPHLSGFILGQDLTFALAFQLESALGIPADFWINAQLNYTRWLIGRTRKAKADFRETALAGEALRKSLLNDEQDPLNIFCVNTLGTEKALCEQFSAVAKKLIPTADVRLECKDSNWRVVIIPASLSGPIISHKFDLYDIASAFRRAANDPQNN